MSKNLLQNLASFQDEMENIEILKSKEAYGYNYADLDAILTIVRPIMRTHNIGYYHNTDYDVSVDKNVVVTTLYNLEDVNDKIVSRTLIDGNTKLAKMNTLMVEGSAITYFRRYHIVAMLGLLTDEDHDAGGKRKQSKATQTTSKSSTPGRSVESNAEAETDYISIFSNLVKNKPREKVEKTLNMYKAQISNEQLTEINKIIKDAYEN